jgi:PadR family transcriptional regulator, regulatory protein PadR
MPHALSSGLPRNFLRPCLLLLLREDDAHGYELAENLGTFGFDSSDPGALYRALRKLEDEGLVRSDWERSESGPQRRVYSLTPEGIQELDVRATDLADGERRIDAFLDRYLKARRLPKNHRRSRAINGRLTAHREATKRRAELAQRPDVPAAPKRPNIV